MAIVSGFGLLAAVACAGTIPADSWKPSAALPSNSYFYLERDAGYDGQPAATELDTQANATIVAREEQGTVTFGAAPGSAWVARFGTRAPFGRMVPGYYPGTEYPPSDPAVPDMQVEDRISGFPCDAPTGWFAVDGITYASDGTLASLDLRFEQHCGGEAALRGQIHWFAGDPTLPPGPVDPPPADLWRPAPGAIPSSGSYIYLEGEPGNSAFDGASQLFATPRDFVGAGSSGLELDVIAASDLTSAGGNFLGIIPTQTRLTTGYYPNIERFGSSVSGARADMVWTANFHTCYQSAAGWFAIDEITFSGTRLMSFTIRFELRCDGETASMHGQTHWTAAPA